MRKVHGALVKPRISAAAEPQARMVDSETLSGALILERNGAVDAAPASNSGLWHASSPLFSNLAVFFHSGCCRGAGAELLAQRRRAAAAARDFDEDFGGKAWEWPRHGRQAALVAAARASALAGRSQGSPWR